MTKHPMPKRDKVVNWDTVEPVYVNRVISAGADGATICVNLGRQEVRYDELEGQPSEPVVTVCDKLVLTPKAAADLANILTRTLAQAGYIPSEKKALLGKEKVIN
ncbi:hypothetical protein [Roseibium sp. RKSG952]|uniref:hypothetical protein n=1 Tax=Roseibium sp. RKSG952 TaxID=2529384 RepID=UPI0012BCBC37|nr:hypothetical protein [Roseibium sp. RKSG952]MTH99396.1 hypothetical protein [Roseibium sp. RKSG952]